jgi:hypothetical protein
VLRIYFNWIQMQFLFLLYIRSECALIFCRNVKDAKFFACINARPWKCILYWGSGDKAPHILNFEMDGSFKYPSSLRASDLCFEMSRVRMSTYRLLASNFAGFIYVQANVTRCCPLYIIADLITSSQVLIIQCKFTNVTGNPSLNVTGSNENNIWRSYY